MTKSLSIIVGSTRTGRIGRSIAEWVSERARAAGFDEVALLDLKTEALPQFDAPVPPMRQAPDTPAAKAWAAKIGAAERILVLTPEYNRGVPAGLKSAIDTVYSQWHDKPTAIVSYGYMDGGQRAASHLRDSLEFLKTDLLPETAALQLTEQNTADGFVTDKVAPADAQALDNVLAALGRK